MPLKPFKTLEEQIAILESRGLEVPDHALARNFLLHNNYYRLSAYRFPFEDAKDHFIPGTSFDDLCRLYRFDRGFRLLVGEACKSLEISVRSRWAYVMGQKHGGLAYEDPAHFRNAQYHTKHLATLDHEISRSHEVFIKHHQQNYNMPRPPIWAACEVMSFNLLSRFYANIRQSSTRKTIAKTYDLSASGLESLLKHTAYFRNLCAHHSRLWNRAFTITVSLPTSQPAAIIPALNPTPPADRLVYNSLVLLAHITTVVAPASDWKHRLKTHLLTLNRPDHSEMGFPPDWQNLPFWK